MFLYNVSTQEPFQETEIWDRVCLRNIQKFDEMLYCGMTNFRNVKLGVFRQYQNTKTILRKKMWDRKFQKFQLSNFTLTWSNEEKMNSVRLDMTYSK